MSVLTRARSYWAGPGRRPAWRRRTARKAAAALVAAVAVLLLGTALRPPPPEPTVAVVTAARDLASGAVLTAADLTTARLPRSVAGSAGSARADADRLVGRVLAGPVEAGEPVRASRVLTPGALAGHRGRVAVAVPLTSAAMADAVRAGDVVDLVVGGRRIATGAPVIVVTAAPAAGGLGTTAARELLVAVRPQEAPGLSSVDPGTPASVGVVLRPT